MHTLGFWFFFFTTITLACHYGYWSSMIMPLLSSLSTSSFTIWFLLGANFLLYCLTCLNSESTFNLYVISLGSIPSMLDISQAKQCFLSLRNLRRFCLVLAFSLVLIQIFRSGLLSSRATSLIDSRASSASTWGCLDLLIAIFFISFPFHSWDKARTCIYLVAYDLLNISTYGKLNHLNDFHFLQPWPS